MCFLALIYKIVPGHSVVLAANRDEYLDRPGTGPRELLPGVWGGQDPRAGGTWLGATRDGLAVALTNIHPPQRRLANARSRGLLCLEALALSRAADLPAFARQQTARHAYNEFNLLAADSASAKVAVYAGGELTIADLAPGVHIVGNTALDDPDDPKIARGRELLRDWSGHGLALGSLASVCRDHGRRDDRADAICIHGPDHGTLSSALIALHQSDPRKHRLLWADGNPCESEYRDWSSVFGAESR